jgi:hypothetical protein
VLVSDQCIRGLDDHTGERMRLIHGMFILQVFTYLILAACAAAVDLLYLAYKMRRR